MVHSLEGIPEEHSRDYFIYLLDYGWKEPLSDALRNNFGKMATLASQKKNAVVIMRTDEGVHFNDEVLSWHNINGDDAEREQLLPAILVTNRHPAEFKKRAQRHNEDLKPEPNLKLVLFPLKKYCSTTSEVVELIQKIFASIKLSKDLNDFGIVKEKRKGQYHTMASSLIIEPTSTGTNISISSIQDFFSQK